MTYTPIQVANHFIRKYGRIGFRSIHKLLYLSHGWHLALKDEPLFEEQIEAWQLGPVYRSVYVHRKNQSLDQVFGPVKDREVISDEWYVELFSTIYKVYGKRWASQLVALTHAPDTPWSKTTYEYRKDDEEFPLHLKIENDIIKEHFVSLRKDFSD